LLSDPERALANAYRALKPDGHGIQRTVYAIRSDGTIAFAARGAPLTDDIVAPFKR
jgi:peroxiredoxin